MEFEISPEDIDKMIVTENDETSGLVSYRFRTSREKESAASNGKDFMLKKITELFGFKVRSD